VNIEFHSTLAPHFQQERLASFLVRDIGSSHDFMNLERLFAQSRQDIVSIIQHAFSLIVASLGSRKIAAFGVRAACVVSDPFKQSLVAQG
jgi:hypothetical protein